MSFLGDALKTIESVVLLRSKVELLDRELNATNEEVREVVRGMIQIDRRLVRIETLEEVRTGTKALPRIQEN